MNKMSDAQYLIVSLQPFVAFGIVAAGPGDVMASRLFVGPYIVGPAGLGLLCADRV